MSGAVEWDGLIDELASAFLGQVQARGAGCAEDRRANDAILDRLVAVPTRPASGTEPG